MEKERQNSALCTDDRLIRRADCVHCAIRNRMLFADVDVDAAAQALAPVTNVRYQHGDAIYQQGGEAHSLYSLRKGVVKLSVISAEGDLRIVRLLGPGAAFGLECLLDQPYHNLAEPLLEADVCRIPANVVKQIALAQPQLYQRLMAQWQEHIELADSHLLKLSAGSINDRVINLLQLLEATCSQGGTAFILPTNQDCAALVAARIESVSRVMAELKRTGVLTQSGNGDWQLQPTQ